MKKYSFKVDEYFELDRLEEGISNLLREKNLSFTKNYVDNNYVAFSINFNKQSVFKSSYSLKLVIKLNNGNLDLEYIDESVVSRFERITSAFFGTKDMNNLINDINNYVKKVMEKEVFFDMNMRRRIIAATPIISLITFLVMGYVFNMWAYGCFAFLLIPVMPILLGEVDLDVLYPILVCCGYFALGFGFGWWHPGWIIFLTIPVYYILFPAKYRRMFRTKYNYEN